MVDERAADPSVTLREIAPAAFLPPALFALGQGAIAPVVVITAQELGATAATAALVVAIAGLGQLIADIPAGALAARFGERPAMVAASILTAASLAVCMWAPNLPVFAAAMFATGAGTAVWQLARQSYVTAMVPFHLRGRAMSTLGGVYRIGLFVGPFLGGAVVHLTGQAGAYGVHLVAALAAGVVLLLVSDLPKRPAEPALTATPRPAKGAGFAQVLRSERPTFRTIGFAVLLVSAVRASRQVVLPLWGVHLGLSAATIAVIFGVSGAVDMLLFYPAGRVLDRYGRVWGAVPTMIVLGVAHIVLPLAGSAVALTLVGVLLGIGNGLGSGIVMTLGADLAPPDDRPVFFGIWRLMSDAGNGAGPFAVAGITAVASLAAACVAMGAVGFAGAALLGYWIPRRGRPIG